MKILVFIIAEIKLRQILFLFRQYSKVKNQVSKRSKKKLRNLISSASLLSQFALKLAELKHIPYHRRQAQVSKEPLVRQNLILAHQISRVSAEKNCTLKQIAGWINITHSRICHIANMLLVSPLIQEEILLSTDKALYNIPEYRLREVIKELDWDKQQEIWKDLLKL